MSRSFTEDDIDDISTKHVQMNQNFLTEFFRSILSSRAFVMLEKTGGATRLREAVDRLKHEYKKLIYRKATYSVPSRRTFVNPSPSADVYGRNCKSPRTPDYSSSSYRSQTTSPKTPDFVFQTKIPEAPMNFKTSETTSSPRTPEMQFSANSTIPGAPKQTGAVRKCPRRLVPASEGDDEEYSQDADALKCHRTPKTTMRSARSFRNAPKAPSFKMTIPSPNKSGITSITCDKNLSNEEIDQVNTIIKNISASVGEEISPSTNNTVSLSTRNPLVVSGKYKLYKVFRL